jgi:hypothetical protein
MLATIRNRTHWKIAGLAFLAAFTLGFTSCATKKETALIDDPNARKETALPWNEQQKWEQEGEASALNQQRRY